MNRADIDEPADIAFHTFANDVACSLHIHRTKHRPRVGGDGDDACAVDHAGLLSRAGKERRERSFIENIAENRLNTCGKQLRIRVIGQDQRPCRRTAYSQLPQDSPAEKSGCPRHKISVIHANPSFRTRSEAALHSILQAYFAQTARMHLLGVMRRAVSIRRALSCFYYSISRTDAQDLPPFPTGSAEV